MFPDPALKEGKGLVHLERFLGLDDVSFLNSVPLIRFMPCVYHTTLLAIAIHLLHAHMCVRAVDALPCQYNALSCQSYDMLYPVHPRKHTRLTRPFPRGSLGTRLEEGGGHANTYRFRITSDSLCLVHIWQL